MYFFISLFIRLFLLFLFFICPPEREGYVCKARVEPVYEAKDIYHVSINAALEKPTTKS